MNELTRETILRSRHLEGQIFEFPINSEECPCLCEFKKRKITGFLADLLLAKKKSISILQGHNDGLVCMSHTNPWESKLWVGQVIVFGATCLCNFLLYLTKYLSHPNWIWNRIIMYINRVWELFQSRRSVENFLWRMSIKFVEHTFN